ncbi:MAG: hypothetical protein AAGG38_02730 [Planctomycetota bacterium]
MKAYAMDLRQRVSTTATRGCRPRQPLGEKMPSVLDEVTSTDAVNGFRHGGDTLRVR